MNRLSPRDSNISIGQAKAIHAKFLKDIAVLRKKYFSIYTDLEREISVKEAGAVKHHIISKSYAKRTKKRSDS